MQKVDLFVLGDGLLDRRQMSRRQRVQVGEGPSQALWVGSPEDQVLRKLAWYRLGGEVSERQWADVVAILRVQAHRLEDSDLEAAARELSLDELLRRAQSAARAFNA